MPRLKSTTKKITRNYQNDFLLLGFQPSSSSCEKPECVECGIIMTNDSMKKSKLLAHQKLKHPGSVGRDRAYFTKKALERKKNTSVTLAAFMKKTNETSSKAVRASYAVSMLIAKAGSSHTIGERLVKPALIICAKEMLGEDAANVLQKISLSDDTIRRRQDEIAANLEDQLIEKLRFTQFSLQIDETTINNVSFIMAYVRYVDDLVICEEMLFLKKLTNTRSETIFEIVHSYLDEKNIPLCNLQQIATDGARAMTGRQNGFIAKLKEVAPHVLAIHCIIHREHLAAKSLNSELEAALNVAITTINFIKSNALHDRLFQQLCENEDHRSLILHTEVRWLSKGNSLLRLIELWEMVLQFLFEIKSKSSSKKQKDKAAAIYSELSDIETKAKIFYLADLFSHVNQLNKSFQGRNANLIDIAQKVRSFIQKLALWNLQLQRNEFAFFSNLGKIGPGAELIHCFTNHLSNLKEDMVRRFKDVIELSPPKWIINLKEFDVFIEKSLDPIIAAELIDLKENHALMEILEREGLDGWLKVKSTHPLLYGHVAPFLLAFPTTWLVEAGFSAVTDILSKKRNLLNIDIRGDLRIRVNQSLKIELDKLVERHQAQGSH